MGLRPIFEPNGWENGSTEGHFGGEALYIMGCVIGLIIGCAHDRVIMSDWLIELSCMQDWPGAQETVQEILKGDE